MLIRSQDRKVLFETDSKLNIREENNEFYILVNDNIYNSLGSYKTEKRALEVLDAIQNWQDVKNEKGVTSSTYEMPKE